MRMEVKNPVEVAWAPLDVVVGMRLWPRVEVLSYETVLVGRKRIGREERGGETYGDDVVFLHEARLMACEETEHAEYEGCDGA